MFRDCRQVPIRPASYWIEPSRFAAGEYPDALAAGVNDVIDLTEDDEGVVPYAHILARLSGDLAVSTSRCRFPIPDESVPATICDMVRILDEIDTALSARRVVYLHCRGGVGRTGTAVGCWLVRHGRTGEDALAHLAELWRGVARAFGMPRSPQTREQENYIRGWREELEESRGR